MKPSLYLLIPALFLVSCDQQEVATYDDCITQTMEGVSSDVAARAIIESCQNQFPTNVQSVVDPLRLVIRDEITYEVNSDTPFTGASLTYHANGQVDKRVTFRDGKQDGLHELYRQNGELVYSEIFKDGKQFVEGAVALSALEPRGDVFDVFYEIGSDTPYRGVVVTHHENGLLAFKLSLIGGIPQGLIEVYWEDGQLRATENYANGELDGLREEYREDGTLELSANYTNGNLDGLREEYFEDGTLEFRENYANGELDGLREEYSEYGTLVLRENYKDGEMLGRCYEPDCTPLSFEEKISQLPN